MFVLLIMQNLIDLIPVAKILRIEIQSVLLTILTRISDKFLRMFFRMMRLCFSFNSLQIDSLISSNKQKFSSFFDRVLIIFRFYDRFLV